MHLGCGLGSIPHRSCIVFRRSGPVGLDPASGRFESCFSKVRAGGSRGFLGRRGGHTGGVCKPSNLKTCFNPFSHAGSPPGDLQLAPSLVASSLPEDACRHPCLKIFHARVYGGWRQGRSPSDYENHKRYPALKKHINKNIILS